MFLFRKSKPKTRFDFGKRLDALVAEARKAGVGDASMAAEMAGHIGSIERRSFMAAEARQFGLQPLHKSANIPD
jgi:hypothetical protein